MNVPFLLTNTAGNHPDRTAVVSGDVRLSYRRFNERVNRLAHALIQAGLRKGDRVALMFYNTHQFAEVYFATLKAGGVATPVNFRFVEAEIEYILEDSGAVFFFFGRDFREAVGDLPRRLNHVKEFVSVNRAEGGLIRDYEAFMAGGSPQEPGVDLAENDPCQIMYTSGTTGKSKGAVITHGNVIWNLFNTLQGREDQSGETSLIIGPLYHTAGLNNHFTIQIALAGTSIMVKHFDPARVFSYIEEEKANIISGSPAMYNLLLQHPKADRFDTSSITKCTAGSAILPQAIKKQLMAFFPRANGVYDVYGCTEASPTITILQGRDSMRKHGSVGSPVAFVQARVVDGAGEPLTPGQVGELVCKGPNVMQGYFRNPEATQATIRDGWLHTGDLATKDDEGFIYIVDRFDDMIISGGENIYPREVEEILFQHPSIADAAVVGIPDEVWGETVKAYVVVFRGMELSSEEIIDFCKGRLASYKKPRFIEFVDAIPKNPSGKVLKRLLREKDSKGGDKP